MVSTKKYKVMKAKELQIGDYVNYRGQVIKVTSLYDKGGSNEVGWSDKESVWVNADNVEPIPLIRIHLAKNGFEADEADEIFIYQDGYEIRVSFDDNDKELGLEPYIYLNINFAEKLLSMEIEYVHQLQQVMRIMGCDKTIEL